MAETGIRHLLLAASGGTDHLAGWRRAVLEGAELADDGAVLRLETVPSSGRPLVDASGSFGGLVAPIGLAIDCQGTIYILDAQGPVIRRFDPCREQFDTLPCIGGVGSEPRQLNNPHGLAISASRDLYVTDSGNRRVQVFALKGMALRRIWGPLKVVREAGGAVVGVEQVTPASPAASPRGSACTSGASFPEGTWQPWDISVSCRNQFLVSDYSNGLIHVFDACGEWQQSYDG